MIDLTAQAATYPSDVLYAVLAEIFDRVQDAVDASAAPPELEMSIAAVHRHQRQNSAERLDRALGDLAHAAVAQLVRRRALIDPRTTGR